jgi:hypothetical protein
MGLSGSVAEPKSLTSEEVSYMRRVTFPRTVELALNVVRVFRQEDFELRLNRSVTGRKASPLER